MWLKIEQFLIMWFFVIYRKQNRKCLSNRKVEIYYLNPEKLLFLRQLSKPLIAFIT